MIHVKGTDKKTDKRYHIDSVEDQKTTDDVMRYVRERLAEPGRWVIWQTSLPSEDAPFDHKENMREPNNATGRLNG